MCVSSVVGQAIFFGFFFLLHTKNKFHIITAFLWNYVLFKTTDTYLL